MRFRVLSHAGLQVSAGGVELLCDPWLVGSCYWRSWWNYPPVSESIVRQLKPDFIYLTHLHWDHFHGPSLRLFPKTTRFIVPYLRNDRISRDLRNMGFGDVTELRHGQIFELGSRFTLQSFHIGPVFTDSAVVIRADDKVILNANDAKLAGLPLSNILKQYPIVDFCLRSHSSANARNCLHVIGEPDANQDDNEHYLRAFALFMNSVRPKFAIPFASNSCLLHRDVVSMNDLVQTPLKVKEYFDRFVTETGIPTKLQIMVSGDSWSSESGFNIALQDYFENREAHLVAYARRVSATLEKFYVAEDRIRVTELMLRTFIEKLLRETPVLLRPRLPKEPILIISKGGGFRASFAVNLRSASVTSISREEEQTYEVRAEFPSYILYQSMRLNMFSQAWISKRVHYYFTKGKRKILQSFLRRLEYSEAEVFPLRNLFTYRCIRALSPRWREAVLYCCAVWHLARGRGILESELRLLSGRQYGRLAAMLRATRNP